MKTLILGAIAALGMIIGLSSSLEAGQTQWVNIGQTVNDSFSAPSGDPNSIFPGPAILAYLPVQGEGNQIWPNGATLDLWSPYISQNLLPEGGVRFPFVITISGTKWYLAAWQITGQLLIGQAPNNSSGTGTLVAYINGAEVDTDTETLGVLMSVDYTGVNEIGSLSEQIFGLNYNVPGASYVEQLEGALTVNGLYATKAPTSAEEAWQMVLSAGPPLVHRLSIK